MIAIGLLLTGLLFLRLAPKPLTLLPSYRFDELGFVLIRQLGLDTAHGLKSKLVHLADSADRIEAFRKGATDILLSTPDVALTLAAGGEDVRLIYAYSQWPVTVGDNPNLILNVIIVRRAALDSQSDTYRRLVQAWDSMCAAYEADPARCRTLLADYRGRPVADLAAEAHAFRFLSLADNLRLFSADGGADSVGEILRSVYTLMRSGNPDLPELDPTTLCDPSIIQKARPQT